MGLDGSKGEKIRAAIEQFGKNLKRDIATSSPFDKTKNGFVTKVTPIGYTVRIENKEYPNVQAIEGATIRVGDVVVCQLPNNQMSQMYIIGKKVNLTNGTGGGGGGTVADVQLNGISVVVNGVASLIADTTPTANSGNLVTSGGVYAALENYVTLATDQTISGKKTFTGGIDVDGTLCDTIKNVDTDLVNPTFLPNGDLTINTMGSNTYQVISGSVVDGNWYLYNQNGSTIVTLNTTSGGATVDNTNGTTFATFRQYFRNYQAMAGKIVTISAYVRSVTGNVKIYVEGAQSSIQYSSNLTTGLNSVTVACSSTTSLMQIGFNLSAGASLDFLYLKGEIGESATPFTPTEKNVIGDNIVGKNLLYNSDFFVNTKAVDTWNGNDVEILDGWLSYGATVTKVSNGLQVVGGSSSRIYQKVNDIGSLWGKPISLSASINGNVISYSGTITGTIPTSDTNLLTSTYTNGFRFRFRYMASLGEIRFLLDCNVAKTYVVNWCQCEQSEVPSKFIPPVYEKEKWAGVEISDLAKPNLLVNGDFTINPRGLSSYSANGFETVANWILYSNGSVTVTPLSSGGVQVQNNGSTNVGDLTQIIPSGHILYGGKDLTLSVNTTIGGTTSTTILQAKLSSSGTSAVKELPSSSGNIYIEWTSGNIFKVWLRTNQGKTISYNWAKLELGEIPTENTPTNVVVEEGSSYAYTDAIDLTNQTIDLNNLTFADGKYNHKRYVCKTSGGSANISNKPMSDYAFVLDVELVRWASTSDYVTKQTLWSVQNYEVLWIRTCVSGTWSAWFANPYRRMVPICATGGATQAKIVNQPSYTLRSGNMISVYFLAANTVANPTLNINGTGAKPIYVDNAAATASNLTAGWHTFYYNGTNYYTGTTFDSFTVGFSFGTGQMRQNVNILAGEAITANRLIYGKEDNKYYTIGASAAINTLQPILYANSAINSGATGSNNWAIRNQSAANMLGNGSAVTLTAYAPVFLKGVLTGHTFTLPSSNWWTQTIPTTEDGFQYMLLGYAYSTTYIRLYSEHPIYAYQNGAFRNYGGTIANYANTAGSAQRASKLNCQYISETLTGAQTSVYLMYRGFWVISVIYNSQKLSFGLCDFSSNSTSYIYSQVCMMEESYPVFYRLKYDTSSWMVTLQKGDSSLGTIFWVDVNGYTLEGRLIEFQSIN